MGISHGSCIAEWKQMTASLCFMLEAILGIVGSKSLLHFGAVRVRLNAGPPFFVAGRSVRSPERTRIIYTWLDQHYNLTQLHIWLS